MDSLDGCSRYGNSQIAELLLGYGADHTMQDVNGRTAFSVAFEKCSTDICALIESKRCKESRPQGMNKSNTINKNNNE
jgi:hypothetical protein